MPVDTRGRHCLRLSGRPRDDAPVTAQWRILRRLRRSRLIPELVVAEWRLTRRKWLEAATIRVPASSLGGKGQGDGEGCEMSGLRRGDRGSALSVLWRQTP